MKRYYDIFVEFYLYTAPHDDEYSMTFDVDWRSKDMIDFMCDKYDIDPDSISETRHTIVKRYKLSKDD